MHQAGITGSGGRARTLLVTTDPAQGLTEETVKKLLSW